MATYEIPRNVKGESRILFIFTTKSLLYTVAGAVIGAILRGTIFYMLGTIPGLVIIAVPALIGFAIGTMKMPELGKFEFAKKTGGENLDSIIIRFIKFRTKGRKIYVYKEGKNND